MNSRRTHPGILVAIAVAAAVVLVPSMAGAAPTGTVSCCPLPTFGPGPSYHPTFDPKGFSPNVTNPFFPLKVGRTLVYTGVKDGKTALNLAFTTSRTKVIDHVTTRVVEDRLYLDNVLEERTSDYYAQDACGNVWYFGEDTATLDAHGHVISTDGSFHAGVASAQPGVFMQAHPTINRQFRQEWFQGHAEDTFKVIGFDQHVTVPAGSFHHALRTAEKTDLEPGVRDNKFYVAGIGEVVETAVHGPTELLQLVEIIS